MSYEDTYNYKNYPYLPGRSDISLDYNVGLDLGLPPIGPQRDTSGVGLPNSEAYMNRAWMNVDQFNFLAGRLNSVMAVKPYTFNDYYEFFPYESGSYIVPKDLYSVEFLKNEEEFTTTHVPADTLAEALSGTSGLLKHDLNSADISAAMGASSGLMKRSQDTGDGNVYVTSAAEILYWYKNTSADHKADKTYAYFFGFINHKTGWDIKRSPEGWEDFEQWESVEYEIPSNGNAAVGTNASGNWWINKARVLGMTIKDESDLPDNYVAEMEKHGSDLSVGNYSYNITAGKTENPIANSLQDSCHSTTGALGRYRTAYNYTGGDFLLQVPLEVFPVRTSNCSPNTGSFVYRSVDHYSAGRISGTDWSWEKTPAFYSSESQNGEDTLVSTITYTPPNVMSGNSPANEVAKNAGNYYVNRTAPANGIQFDDLDVMPDYFVNQWMSDVSAKKNPQEPARQGYIWHSGFYNDNDMYLYRGWSGGSEAGIEDPLDGWTNATSNAKNIINDAADWGGTVIGSSDATTWNSLGSESANSSHKSYINKRFEGILAGKPVGYHGGEVYQKPILRGRHLLLNKEQATIDGAQYPHYFGYNIENLSRIHKNAYELLPYAPSKNLNYGLQDPTGAVGQKIDPTRMATDPFNGFAKTYWVTINDVKSKAEELGFRFEFRRLTVPFKLKSFDFSYERVAFMRETGMCMVEGGVKAAHANEGETAHGEISAPCVQNDFCNWQTTGIINTDRVYGPCPNQYGNGMYVQVPMTGNASHHHPWPNFITNNPYGSDLEDGYSKWVNRNPINAIHGDGFDSQNVIFHVDKSLSALQRWENGGKSMLGNGFITGVGADGWRAENFYPTGYGDSSGSAGDHQVGYFWCSDNTCLNCQDNRTNVFGAHAGTLSPAPSDDDGDGLANNLECPCSGELSSGVAASEHCYGGQWQTGFASHKACRDAWGSINGLRRDFGNDGNIVAEGGNVVQDCPTCYRCDSFGAGNIDTPGSTHASLTGLTSDDKRLFKFYGNDTAGTFTFTGVGYRPIVNSSKQFVWADNEEEATWVRPVGVQERYTYKYGNELSSFDIHVIDYISEQAQLNDGANPWRMESVSSWSGNYIYPSGNPSDHGHGSFGYGSVLNSEVTPVTDLRLVSGSRTAYPYRAGDGPRTYHYKVRNYLSFLSAYDQVPILKVNAADDYKEWLSNIVLSLYPKYYYFQEFSDSEFSDSHAMFVYKLPDVKYSDYSVSDLGTGMGYELGALDITAGLSRKYPLLWGIDSSQNAGASFEGETKRATHFSTETGNFRLYPLVNNQPSFFTDFWPRQNIYASGGYVENLNFSSEGKTAHFLNLQDKLSTTMGYKAAIQWYINNAITLPTGSAGNPTYEVQNMTWTY